MKSGLIKETPGMAQSHLNVTVYWGSSVLGRTCDGLLSPGRSINAALGLTQDKSSSEDMLKLTKEATRGPPANDPAGGDACARPLL